MTSNTSNNGLRSLAKLAARTRITCRIVCGSQARVGHAVTNLYGVLRQLQEEASNDRSALTRSGTACKDDLSSLCIDCGTILNDVNNFLRAHKTLSDIEVRILAIWESSFTDRQKAIIDHFESELMRYASRLSRVLIAASTDAMCELKEQLDIKTGTTGYPLSTILNDLTSRLVANDGRLVASGDIRFSMLVKDPKNERVLWGALQHELLGNGLEQASLDQHRNITLRYVRALERRSAFRSSDAAPMDGGKGIDRRRLRRVRVRPQRYTIVPNANLMPVTVRKTGSEHGRVWISLHSYRMAARQIPTVPRLAVKTDDPSDSVTLKWSLALL